MGWRAPDGWRVSSGIGPYRSLSGAAAEEATIVARQLETTSEELHRLRVLSGALEGGLGRLAGGGQNLANGIDRIAGGAQTLGQGIGRLGAGAGRLATGLGALENGTDSLESGLAGGYRRSYPLQAGLSRAAASAVRSSTRSRSCVASHPASSDPAI